MVDISTEQAINGGCRQKFDGLATIVAAREARFAFIADHVGLHSDAVADFEGFDVVCNGDDDAGGFVAEDVVVCDNHGADTAGVPEMDI